MKKDKAFAVLFCISIFALLYAEYLFESTFMHLYIPISIWIFALICSIPIIKKYHVSKVSSFYKIMIFGNTFLFIFLFSSYHFTVGNTYEKDFKIISSSSVTSGNGKGQYNELEPSAEIEYNGILKSIAFSPEVDIKSKKYVTLVLKKSIFGFPVIIKRTSH